MQTWEPQDLQYKIAQLKNALWNVEAKSFECTVIKSVSRKLFYTI